MRSSSSLTISSAPAGPAEVCARAAASPRDPPRVSRHLTRAPAGEGLGSGAYLLRCLLRARDAAACATLDLRALSCATASPCSAVASAAS
jgi:hypothetical protein